MKPHLCHVFPAFGHGGPEVRTAALIAASADAFRHTVISLNGELSGQSRVAGCEEVRLIDATRDGRGPGFRALSRLLGGLRPDLVLTYGWGGTDAIAATRLAGLRRLIHAEDGFLPDEAHGQKFKRLMARRVLLRLAGCLVCPSRNLVRIALGSWWLPTRKIVYLPNGIDTGRFAPGRSSAFREQLGFRPEDTVVGTVGHLRPEKNHARLLDAFAALAPGRSVKLLLLGDGPLREDLCRRACRADLRGRVVFTGIVKDPAEHYRAMDVFALSSDTEQMPLSLLEAMASGLPAVSTDVGDVRDMVCEANRTLVIPLGQEDRYAAALRELIDDSEARRRLGAANRQRCVEEYDLAAATEAYFRLYRDVLEGGQPRGHLLDRGEAR
jgi:glycosyltransferase involved in cell wall biosynthesis